MGVSGRRTGLPIPMTKTGTRDKKKVQVEDRRLSMLSEPSRVAGHVKSVWHVVCTPTVLTHNMFSSLIVRTNLKTHQRFRVTKATWTCCRMRFAV